MEKTLKETIKFPSLTILVLFFLSVGGLIFGLNNKINILFYLLPLIIFLVAFIMSFTRLKIEITPQEIKYKTIPKFPFFIDESIAVKDIKTIEIANVNLVNHFLGWGIKSSKKYGKGFIAGTKYALFIETKEGKKQTFSISDKEAVIKVLNSKSIY